MAHPSAKSERSNISTKKTEREENYYYGASYGKLFIFHGRRDAFGSPVFAVQLYRIMNDVRNKKRRPLTSEPSRMFFAPIII